jgi:hypothetical protein
MIGMAEKPEMPVTNINLPISRNQPHFSAQSKGVKDGEIGLQVPDTAPVPPLPSTFPSFPG